MSHRKLTDALKGFGVEPTPCLSKKVQAEWSNYFAIRWIVNDAVDKFLKNCKDSTLLRLGSVLHVWLLYLDSSLDAVAAQTSGMRLAFATTESLTLPHRNLLKIMFHLLSPDSLMEQWRNGGNVSLDLGRNILWDSFPSGYELLERICLTYEHLSLTQRSWQRPTELSLFDGKNRNPTSFGSGLRADFVCLCFLNSVLEAVGKGILHAEQHRNGIRQHLEYNTSSTDKAALLSIDLEHVWRLVHDQSGDSDDMQSIQVFSDCMEATLPMHLSVCHPNNEPLRISAPQYNPVEFFHPSIVYSAQQYDLQQRARITTRTQSSLQAELQRFVRPAESSVRVDVFDLPPTLPLPPSLMRNPPKKNNNTTIASNDDKASTSGDAPSTTSDQAAQSKEASTAEPSPVLTATLPLNTERVLDTAVADAAAQQMRDKYLRLQADIDRRKVRARWQIRRLKRLRSARGALQQLYDDRSCHAYRVVLIADDKPSSGGSGGSASQSVQAGEMMAVMPAESQRSKNTSEEGVAQLLRHKSNDDVNQTPPSSPPRRSTGAAVSSSTAVEVQVVPSTTKPSTSSTSLSPKRKKKQQSQQQQQQDDDKDNSNDKSSIIATVTTATPSTTTASTPSSTKKMKKTTTTSPKKKKSANVDIQSQQQQQQQQQTKKTAMTSPTSIVDLVVAPARPIGQHPHHLAADTQLLVTARSLHHNHMIQRLTVRLEPAGLEDALRGEQFMQEVCASLQVTVMLQALSDGLLEISASSPQLLQQYMQMTTSSSLSSFSSSAANTTLSTTTGVLEQVLQVALQPVYMGFVPMLYSFITSTRSAVLAQWQRSSVRLARRVIVQNGLCRHLQAVQEFFLMPPHRSSSFLLDVCLHLVDTSWRDMQNNNSSNNSSYINNNKMMMSRRVAENAVGYEDIWSNQRLTAALRDASTMLPHDLLEYFKQTRFFFQRSSTVENTSRLYHALTSANPFRGLFSKFRLSTLVIDYKCPGELSAFITPRHLHQVGLFTKRLLEIGQLKAAFRVVVMEVRTSRAAMTRRTHTQLFEVLHVVQAVLRYFSDRHMTLTQRFQNQLLERAEHGVQTIVHVTSVYGEALAAASLVPSEEEVQLSEEDFGVHAALTAAVLLRACVEHLLDECRVFGMRILRFVCGKEEECTPAAAQLLEADLDACFRKIRDYRRHVWYLQDNLFEEALKDHAQCLCQYVGLPR